MIAIELLRNTLARQEEYLRHETYDLESAFAAVSEIGNKIFHLNDKIQRLKNEIELLENLEKK